MPPLPDWLFLFVWNISRPLLTCLLVSTLGEQGGDEVSALWCLLKTGTYEGCSGGEKMPMHLFSEAPDDSPFPELVGVTVREPLSKEKQSVPSPTSIADGRGTAM